MCDLSIVVLVGVGLLFNFFWVWREETDVIKVYFFCGDVKIRFLLGPVGCIMIL